ncbi:hypothetical protein GCM10027418_16010 [Mariniluteicoccus endophyticus]
MLRKTVRGLAEQAGIVSALLSRLSQSDYTRLTPRPGHRVGTLVGTLIVCEADLIGALSRSTSARPGSLADYLQGERFTRHNREDLARELAQHESGASLAEQFRSQADELKMLLDEPTVPSVVTVGHQSLRLVDLLRATTIELLLGTDDLDTALPHHDIEWSREALATGVRALTEVIAQRHPGRSIEVRVPPFAAVQCGMGDDPSHTRGTPPNVVETDARTFLRLVHDRTRFADEVAAGRLHASGTRSDLSAWFPLLRD